MKKKKPNPSPLVVLFRLSVLIILFLVVVSLLPEKKSLNLEIKSDSLPIIDYAQNIYLLLPKEKRIILETGFNNLQEYLSQNLNNLLSQKILEIKQRIIEMVYSFILKSLQK